MLASITSSFTSQVASHGVYAVFGLMAVDAVFPAASELVMLYAGAVAAGVFATAHGVTVFGAHVGFGAGAYLALALSGTLGYLAGALVGWAVGLYGGRPLLERRGGWVHLTPERLDRAEAWFRRWGNLGVLLGRVTPLVRSFVSIPAGVFEMLSCVNEVFQPKSRFGIGVNEKLPRTTRRFSLSSGSTPSSLVVEPDAK